MFISSENLTMQIIKYGFQLNVFLTLLFLQRLGMDKSLPWFLDASLCFGIILHGFVGSKLDVNIPLVPLPSASLSDSGLSFVYALAGLYSYLAGLALAPYRVFYALAVIGISTTVFRILERRGRTKENYSSKRRHFHRH